MSKIYVDEITGFEGTETGAPITLSGDTATLGSGVIFPAGHIITTSTIDWEKSQASDIDLGSTTFAETGIEVSITPKLAAGSSGSKIVLFFHTGSATQTEVGTTNQLTIARATSSSTAIGSATDLSDSGTTTDYYSPGEVGRYPLSFCFVDESGYSAGTTYYYQVYGKSAAASNPFRIVRAGANYSLIAFEIKQ